MPKSPSSIMKRYRVRIDGSTDEMMTDFCKKVSSVYLLVHHTTTTENPHYHVYIETHYSQGNFSALIKKDLNVKGADYSNKACSEDRRLEYLSYLFNSKKGNVARCVTYAGFSVIDVATYRENSQRIAQEFQTKMKTKKTQYDVSQVVLNRMDPTLIHMPGLVYDTVIEVLKESQTMARPNHVKDIIATVMAYSNNKSAKSQIKDLTLKFFSQ